MTNDRAAETTERRDYRLGNPTRARRPIRDRFDEKVDYSGECWLWLASLVEGYGQFWTGQRIRLAHLWLWEQTNGDVPAGIQLHHRCGNRACVRPDHLRRVRFGRRRDGAN